MDDYLNFEKKKKIDQEFSFYLYQQWYVILLLIVVDQTDIAQLMIVSVRLVTDCLGRQQVGKLILPPKP